MIEKSKLIVRNVEEAVRHLSALETNINVHQHRHRVVRLLEDAVLYADSDDPVVTRLRQALSSFADMCRIGRRNGRSFYEDTHRFLNDALMDLQSRQGAPAQVEVPKDAKIEVKTRLAPEKKPLSKFTG